MTSTWNWTLNHKDVRACGSVTAHNPADAGQRALAKLLEHAGAGGADLAHGDGVVAEAPSMGESTFSCSGAQLVVVPAPRAHTRQQNPCACRSDYPRRFYHLSEPGLVGDGTVGALIDWMGRYIGIVLPDNAIEYWSDGGRPPRKGLRRDERVPGTPGADLVHHVAAFPRPGNSEGIVIEMLLNLVDGSWVDLGWAKSFSTPQQAWKIAHACSVALEDIVMYGSVPALVDMVERLPVGAAGGQAPCTVVLTAAAGTLRVADARGTLVFADGPVVGCSVDDAIADWKLVLLSAGVRQIDVVRSQ